MRKSILIILFSLLGVLSAQAYDYDFKVDGIYYNLISGTDDQVEVTSSGSWGNGYSGSVDIPSTVTYDGNTYTVTAIGARAFWYCTDMTSVTIPNSVTSIGVDAFSECSGLTSVTIPNSVTSIGVDAFSECSGLTSVTIGESVTSIGDAAFYECSGLTSVTIPNSVTSIGERAFWYCKGLTSLTIGEGVTSIGDAAFADCSGLRSVEWNAVACQDFHSYSCCPFIDAYNNSYEYNITTITFGNQVKHIPSYLCSFMEKPWTVTIGESVTSIGNSAFYGCCGLTSVYYTGNLTQWCGIKLGGPLVGNTWYLHINNATVTDLLIPDDVTTIGDYAFYGCSGLTSVTIGESVTSIGDSAFADCRGLKSLTIPESVTYIGYNAFSWTGLKSVYYTGNLIQWCGIKFGGPWVKNAWNLYINNVKVTDLLIPDGMTTIGDYAFYGCSGLTTVTIPESMTTIGDYAFSGCSGLTTVTIPESVTSIGDAAFRDCIGLRSVEWNAVACQDFKYDKQPFRYCVNITSITFGSEVEYIPAYLCYDLSGLTAITLPRNIDTIGRYAFSGCNKLLSVTSLSKIPPYCASAPVFSFYEGTLFVPRGCKMAYQTAQEWYKFSRIEETETIYTVTVQPNDAAMGRVTGGGEYQEGEQAILAAIPNQGYYFVRWDDGSTNNPRMLTVGEDITLTAIFAQGGDAPTANENSEADNFRVYVQDRTIYLSEARGLVQVYNMAGQCVYNGRATAIPVPHPGVYILRVADSRSRKILVK